MIPTLPQVAATLYKDNSAAPGSPYQKKCVQFFLQEAESPQGKGPALARAVLDLAEFGDVEGPTQKLIPISISRQVALQLGVPTMSLAVKMTGKKTAPPGMRAAGMSLPQNEQ